MELDGDDEGPIGRSTPKTSPSVPRQRTLEMAESPPSKSSTHGTFDVSALMGKWCEYFFLDLDFYLLNFKIKQANFPKSINKVITAPIFTLEKD